MQFTPGVAPTRPDGVKDALDNMLNDITANSIPRCSPKAGSYGSALC